MIEIIMVIQIIQKYLKELIQRSCLLTLTQLMSLDVNAPIIIQKVIREKKWKKYGENEIGVPDYH